MKELPGMVFLAVFLVLFLFSNALAQAPDKQKPQGPTCQEQLVDLSIQATNLDTDRDQKERIISAKQLVIYQLQNQITLLQKQVSDMKKVVDAIPKPEEKPADEKK